MQIKDGGEPAWRITHDQIGEINFLSFEKLEKNKEYLQSAKNYIFGKSKRWKECEAIRSIKMRAGEAIHNQAPIGATCCLPLVFGKTKTRKFAYK